MVNLLATPSLSQSITNGIGPKSLVKESAVILCRIVLQICAPVFDQLSDEVAMKLHMLGSLMEDWVPGKSTTLSTESTSVGESAPACDDDVILIDH